MRTHGKTNHPLFKVWCLMIDRCYKPKATNYRYYGKKGIRVCREWKNNFKDFYDWAIINGWKPGLELERKKNYKNYNPANCTFATRKQQCRNRTSNVMISYKGERMCAIEWAEKTGIPVTTIYQRATARTPKNRIFAPVKPYTYLTINKEKKSLREWATFHGVPYETVRERYAKGVRGAKLFFKGNMRSYRPH